MTYLLDTNVVSELRKTRGGAGNSGVSDWQETVGANELYLSAITTEELEIGVLRLERRDRIQGGQLREWLTSYVLTAFAGRIIPVDLAVARRSARLHVPDRGPIRDAYIAATALVHGMTVVTRNVADFQPTGVSLFNPWS